MHTIDEIVIPALERLAENVGTLTSTVRLDDSRFVVAIVDDPTSSDNAISVAIILEALLRNGITKLVGVDGAFGPVDFSYFKAFPDAEIREDVAGSFVKDHKLRGAEYVCVSSNHRVELLGLDEKQQYVEGLRLWREFLYEGFCDWQKERAKAFCVRLLERMAVLDTQVTAVTLCGKLPQYLVSEIEKSGFSFALVETKSSKRQREKEDVALDAMLDDILCNLLSCFGVQLSFDGKLEGDEAIKRMALNDCGFPNFDVEVAVNVIQRIRSILLEGKYEESIAETRRGLVMWSYIERTLKERKRVGRAGTDGSALKTAQEFRELLEQQLEWMS